MRTRKRRVILLVSPHSGFHRGMLRGIWQYSSSNGPWVFLREPRNLLWTAPAALSVEMLRSWNAEGAICEMAAFPQVKKLGIPTIVCPITETPDGYPSVETDSAAIARMAAEHLVELGFHNFAFCGFDALRWSRIRGEEFSRDLHDRGFDVHLYRQQKELHRASWEEEEPALSEWLRSLPKPIGLFCANDDRAANAAESCRLSDLRVPDDVAILGVDDDQYICELFYPPLSSVALSTEKAGYEVAALLDRFMNGEDQPAGQRVVVTPTRVVQRASTDIIAVTDPLLREALKFIKARAHQVILVADVAEAMGMSTRRLEQRFREQLGSTVMRVIQQMRARHIAQLLANTDRPIGEIALSLGYSSHRHIARFFGRIMGTTPQAYREQSRVRLSFRRSEPNQDIGS